MVGFLRTNKFQSTDPYNNRNTNLNFFFLNYSKKDLSYSAINSHQSALNLFLSLNQKDLKITSRLLKGVYNNRPAVLKYSNIWNPQPILNYLEKCFPLDKLSLKDITLKLVTLIVFTTVHRVQTLAKISVKNIYREGSIRIKIPEKN